MKITMSIAFNTWEECYDFCETHGGVGTSNDHTVPLKGSAKEKAAPAEKADTTEKEADTLAAKKPKEGKKPKADVKALIVEARKVLNAANKKSGKNVALEMIEGAGYKSLADIKDADVLQKLIEKAGEYNAV